MKIGIITQPLRLNYGGLLQNFALQTILERLGHKVETLDPPLFPSIPFKKKPIIFGKRFIKKILWGEGHILQKHIIREYQILSQNITSFVDQYLNRRECCNFNTINKNDYDALIVGSDQVWRPKYNKCIENCFLDFAYNWDIKRISYAASFGTDEKEFSNRQLQVCKKLIHKFSSVSVRENSGLLLCHEYFNIEAKLVLDPTLLLDSSDYINLFKDKYSLNNDRSDNLVCYLLNTSPNKQRIIDLVSKEKGLKPHKVYSQYENVKAKLTERIQIPIEQWLHDFYNAKFVITDSFHGCIFSIIFNKQFIVLENCERGNSRFLSLLQLLNLESRLFSGDSSDVYSVISENINWSDVNLRLKKMQTTSLSFLNESLSENN